MDKEYLSKIGTICIPDSDDIEFKIGLIKLIDDLKKDNLVCGHKEFIEECKYCWCNCDLEIIKTVIRG
ncbi:hypothetical protein [Spiroplasma endosymbiont of Danaus chrysippus]|uniref:hypothetical protein n=1 Tax=Spiroplasma endosymbiont of Danaus chrysippus TaxID=2691041 RepID=UPI00157AE9BC|nr:hypothetical protein [Spiroplasma endosymbiont of Danaus chrysippus]